MVLTYVYLKLASPDGRVYEEDFRSPIALGSLIVLLPLTSHIFTQFVRLLMRERFYAKLFLHTLLLLTPIFIGTIVMVVLILDLNPIYAAFPLLLPPILRAIRLAR